MTEDIDDEDEEFSLLLSLSRTLMREAIGYYVQAKTLWGIKPGKCKALNCEPVCVLTNASDLLRLNFHSLRSH